MLHELHYTETFKYAHDYFPRNYHMGNWPSPSWKMGIKLQRGSRIVPLPCKEHQQSSMFSKTY